MHTYARKFCLDRFAVLVSPCHNNAIRIQKVDHKHRGAAAIQLHGIADTKIWFMRVLKVFCWGD